MLKRLVITDAHDWVLPADGACRCGTTRDSSAVSGGAATERGGAGGVSADGDAAAAPGSGDSSCSRTSGTAPRELRLVGGVDISFDKADPDDACAALVVVELPSLEVVYERYARVRMRLPYISGFLAFREMELLLPLLREAREEHPDRFPDVILVVSTERPRPHCVATSEDPLALARPLTSIVHVRCWPTQLARVVLCIVPQFLTRLLRTGWKRRTTPSGLGPGVSPRSRCGRPNDRHCQEVLARRRAHKGPRASSSGGE